MVESVSGINAATATSAAASSSDKVQEKAKQEETQKTEQQKTTDKITANEQNKTPLDRLKVQQMVLDYIAQLEKTHDYPVVKERLERYKFMFKVDDFMKKYPEIYTEQDLKTILYNETVNLL